MSFALAFPGSCVVLDQVQQVLATAVAIVLTENRLRALALKYSVQCTGRHYLKIMAQVYGLRIYM